MNSCDDVVSILRYLDNEFSVRELETFRAHLQSCPTCKVRLEGERAFSTVLHRSRPLYQAPEQLRSQVSDILKQHPAAGNAEGIYERLLRILQRPFPNRWPYLLSWGVLVTALMVAAAERNPRKTAIILENESVSYEQLDHSTTSLARWFLQQGD